MQIVEFGRKFEHKVVACGRILGVTAVDGVSGEDGGIAEIFEAAVAVRANSIHTANPGDSNARAQWQLTRSALDNITNNLMSGNERFLSRRQLSLLDVQVGTADSASANPQQNAARRELGFGMLLDLKRVFRRSQDGGFQRAFL